jgi:glyoxylase-like metal-dependent hydrolase (beta-lactamase superfamily II)
MNLTRVSLIGMFLSVILVITLGFQTAERDPWKLITSGVYRSESIPYSYMIVDEKHAVAIDASTTLQTWQKHHREPVELVLLTQHDRDSVRELGSFLSAQIPVRAAPEAKEFLDREAVTKFWKESIPLRNSRTGYFVHPVGFEGVRFDLKDGEQVISGSIQLRVIATPGPSRDHLAFEQKQLDRKVVFTGDLLTENGKISSPFTSDWDHWTDAGIKPYAESLCKVAKATPNLLLTSRSEPIKESITELLGATASKLEEVGFLKSFERFSDRLGASPEYPFLVPKEQVGSAGDQPWSKVSEHCFITGNTYVLVSKEDRAFMVIDPWGKRSIDRIEELRRTEKLGKMEVITFSHAHYDHFDGVYLFPDRESFEIWGLDVASTPLQDPFQRRAPFLDERPIRFDHLIKDGGKKTWREYSFTFNHLPGQSLYTMALQTVVDGKRSIFTADNFFHRKQYSGTGGWMGLNRSYPRAYGLSAAKVLEWNPEWILAEHGGPYVFNADDYRRRMKWGEAAGRAGDQICITGKMEWDWNPYLVEFIPYLQKLSLDSSIEGVIEFHNPSNDKQIMRVELLGRGIFENQEFVIEVAAGQTKSVKLEAKSVRPLPKGRQIFELRTQCKNQIETVDSWLAIDVTGEK